MRDRRPPLAAACRAALLVLLLVVVARALARDEVAAPRRPSFVLVVLDTVRWDAMSANGAVEGTTPALDAFAASGIRFTHAYAQAHWTLPSHATLFTGLLPSQHGVDWRAMKARDDLVLLAEVLREAGYETFGLSENPWVTGRMGMTQGFDRYAEPRQRTSDAENAIAAWLRERSPDRPFFLFLNLMDAHPPFDVSVGHRFLPPDATAGEVRTVVRSTARFHFCETPPSERERAILRAQYLLGVTRADARLARVLDLLRAARGTASEIAIVTSDHGEMLGEHGLFDHQLGLWDELLHVPLVVSGVPGAPPAVVATPVALADVFPSVLAWAGLAVPPGLAGRPLPLRDDPAAAARPIVAEHTDAEGTMGGPAMQATRAACPRSSGLFGDARALFLWPEKLQSFADVPGRLYALDVDPGEQNDLAPVRSERVGELTALLPAPAKTGGSAPGSGDAALPEEVAERLRALGYLGGDGAGAPAAAPAR
ncbi:MAG TPA: sulfatase [Candidatus Binatia bacterium]|nr:sulfatase [Candidatus Binatia bacterium]